MKYFIDFSDEANEGIRKLKKAGDKQVIKKLDKLIDELEIHPETGTGKPERLKHFVGNRWSRRITDTCASQSASKHRLVYEIFEQIVTVDPNIRTLR